MVNLLRKEYLVSYDIENNKTRTTIHKYLARQGMISVQKSVFWGYISTAELNAIKRILEKELLSVDKAFITHTNFNGRGQSFIIGHQREEFKDWDEYGAI